MSSKYQVDKRDVIWSYLAQFFTMGAGMITLPFILHKLSADEIGLNYILLTVGSVIAYVDLGFAPQFARNFTYVFSGAKSIVKEGVAETGEGVDYGLMAYLLRSARYIYSLLALLAMVLLIGVGTPYVYKVTGGFETVPHALTVWILFSIGSILQVYYAYFNSMLLGAGLIKEQKYCLICSKAVNVVVVLGMLYSGMGLVSVSVGQAVSPFVSLIMSYRFFYNKELKENLRQYRVFDRSKIKEIVATLWHNAKRVAVMSVGTFAILRMSMFIAGLYLSLDEFAQYGLMVQLVGILSVCAATYMNILQPRLASLISNGNNKVLVTDFSFALVVSYLLYIAGGAVLVLWGNDILDLIGSNAKLPGHMVLLIYTIVCFLECNHSNFAMLIGSGNRIPFAPASITTGIAVCIGIFIVVRFTTLGIMGLVLVQGICQAAYQNWKWPMVAIEMYHTSFGYILSTGFKEVIRRSRAILS